MSRHEQEAEPILRDEEQDDLKHKKRFRIVVGLMMLFVLALIAGIVLMVININKLSDKKDERDQLAKTVEDLKTEEARRLTEKVFDLSGAQLEDFSLVVRDVPGLAADARIQKLNLTNNLLQAFHFNSIPTLRQLELGGNNVTEFDSNNLNSLKDFHIQQLSQLQDFSGNTMPMLTELDVARLSQLRNFQTNNLENVTKLSLPVQLEIFKGNKLPLLTQLGLQGLEELTTLEGNVIPSLPELTINNSKLLSFASNLFGQLATLNILRNNFSQIIVASFPKLETLNIQSGDQLTTELTISQTPQLKNLKLIMNKLVTALVRNTSLLSFPGTDSNLPLLETLVLEHNQLMTRLDTSKMPQLQNFEVVDTPIDSTDESSLKTLQFKNSKLTAFRHWFLPELESLTLSNNTLMTIFSDNVCYSLKTLVIEGQAFIESVANRFDALEEVRMTNTPYSSVFFISNLYNMKRINLDNNSLTNLSLVKYPNLESLQLDQKDLTYLEVSSLSLKTFVTTLPILNTLVLTGTALQNISGIKYPNLLKNLTISDSPINTLDLLPLSNVSSLWLKNLPVTSLNFASARELRNLYLENVNIPSLYIKNLPYLETIQLQLPSLTDLTISDVEFTEFKEQTLTSLRNLTLDLHLVPQLSLENYPELSKMTLSMDILTDLNVDNTKLTDFGINKLPELVNLRIAKTNLTELNTALPKLEVLQLQDIGSANLFLNFSALPELKTLNITRLANSELNINNASKLSTLLVDAPLQKLTIFNNSQLTQQAIQADANTLLLQNLTALTQYSGRTSTNLQSLTIINCPVDTFANNDFSNLASLELNGVNVQILTLDAFPNLNSLTLKVDSLSTLKIQDLLVTSLVNSDLSNVISFTVVNTPITVLPTLGLPQAKFIDLEKIKVETLDLTLMTSIETLSLIDLPDTFNTRFSNSYPSLKTLTIRNTNITDGLFDVDMPSLTTLTIEASPSFNTLRNCKIPAATDITLIGTSITEVYVNTLTALNRLTIRDPSINFENFQNLNSQLTYLLIQNAGLTTFNKNNLTKLQELYIFGTNNISTIDFVNVSTSLTILKLSGFELATFGYNMGKLTTLEITNSQNLTSFTGNTMGLLTSLSLTKLPNFKTFGTNTITTIRSITISETGMTAFPALSLASLSTLKLQRNAALNTYSQGTLGNLTELQITNCDLAAFQNINYVNLLNLYLSHNKIATLKNITLPKLIDLDLSFNMLDSTANWTFLTNTAVNSVRLDSNTILNFVNCSSNTMKSLSVSSNGLEGLGNLQLLSLLSLDLSNNALTDSIIDSELTVSAINPNIASIDLRGNPFTDAPALLNTLKGRFPSADIKIDGA